MEPLSQSLRTALKKIVKIVGILVGIWLGAAVALYGWQSADSNGYIPHDRTLNVFMTNDWIVGENLTCWLSEKHDGNGKPTEQLDILVCPVAGEKMEPHNITVTFKGNLRLKDIEGDPLTIPTVWQCRRRDGFACDVMASPANRSNP